MGDLTHILNAVEGGDGQAVEPLFPIVYGELRRMAQAKMAAERSGQTLDATGLVHEAYIRLVGSDNTESFKIRGSGRRPEPATRAALIGCLQRS